MKKHLILLFMFCLSLQMVAQQRSITGVVVDAKKEPVIGASIVEKGTSNGTITDVDGKFLLNVEPNITLVISYIGYESQEILLGDKTDISVVLHEDNEVLDEVVVVGYGVQKKSSMTAAVASVSANEIRKQVAGNVASTLQGRTPGVEILQNGGEAGADVKILIRGAGSFGATEPLYVIDGAFSNNGLASLNPADIASMEVLKDGAAAAIYGSRAANGVVLITTKSGVKGKPKVEISTSLSLQTPSKKLDFMNAEEWRSWAMAVAQNSNLTPGSEVTNPTNPGLNTDWQDIYLKNAPMYNVNAGISGGGENSTYNLSLGYLKQDGIIIETGYEKYNARINGSYKKGRLSINENASLSYTSKKPNIRLFMGLPNVPVTNERGEYISAPGEYYIDPAVETNTLALIHNSDVKNTTLDITGSFSLGLNLCKGLDYKLTLGGSNTTTHTYNHISAYQTMWDDNGEAVSGYGQGYTSLTESRGSSSNYTIDNILTYNNSFAGHAINAMVGTSWMREFNRTMSISSDNNDLGAPSVTTYSGPGTVNTLEYNSALLSFFARLNYDYKGRYLLSASIRSDKSSKFAKDYRVGYFPSVSVGWNIHEESFFKIPWINKMKVRASYGELGANFIDPYSFLSLAYGPIPAVFGANQTVSSRVVGYVTKFAQENLKWETAVSKNIGLELSFLNNSLTFTGEYFWKDNNDLLAPLAPLPSSGQTIIINTGDLPVFNSASVRNTGLELSLGYRKVINDWSIDVQGHISFLKNEVRSLGEGVQPIRGGIMSSKFSDRPTITKEGLPIGAFWGYVVTGMDDNGNFVFQDNNGLDESGSLTGDSDGKVDENDKTQIGTPHPDFTYGINLSLGYRNWDFTAFFQGVSGNDIFNMLKYQWYFNQSVGKLADASDYWSLQNTMSKNPIPKTDNYTGGNSLPSTFYIEDGSYFRCKNLQVGYSFSDRLLQKLSMQYVRVYVGVQNLFTITKYSGYDPEVGSSTLFDRGIDGMNGDNTAHYPAPSLNSRIYTLGLSVTF